MGIVIRVILILAGVITEWFVARDAVNFSFIQMVIGVLIFTILIALIAFWPSHWRFGKR